MKHHHILFSLIVIPLFLVQSMRGEVGDTTTVQTFTFGSSLEGKFLFPSKSHRWEKILMYYTLKCNPLQSPACGEWDYLTYTYLYRHTGTFDSIKYWHSNYQINGSTPDSLLYMYQPTWQYQPWFQVSNTTPPTDTFLIANSAPLQLELFSGEGKDGRSQFIWKKDELAAVGMDAGSITGLRFNVISTGSLWKKVHIRLKEVAYDSVRSNRFEESGFTEVVKRDILFQDTGWQTIPFSYPFLYSGSANILIDISYEDHSGSNSTRIASDSTQFPSSIYSHVKDYTLKFRDNDYVTIPANAFNQIDSAITVACWIYGDPLLQPQNNTLFEGVDSNGARVLNVHLPWSDGTIYWDAGHDSSGYDRLNQHTNDPSMYRGKWNHWAFTKDVGAGKMKVYYNGQLWRILSNKRKRMNGIAEFRIGSNGAGNDLFYDGRIEEFSVWNKALSDTSIRALMYQDIQSNHPNFSNLVAYFQFNEGGGFETTNTGSNLYASTLGGYPEWNDYQGVSRFRNGITDEKRPHIIFEKGIYNASLLDSILKIDTIMKPPIMIVLFSDSLHPYMATDTLLRWPTYFTNYHYDSSGNALDSTFVHPDGVLHKKEYPYYGKPFEILERYELARYITPYGNNLSLGEGWTWVYDLTDYAPLLCDSVHLTAGNWQELLDMKFVMIEGTPPRDVQSVQNIYTGTHGYANESQHNLPPVRVKIASDIVNARLKMRITGHGFGGDLDCSEFCPRTNRLLVNGKEAYTHYVWRKCGINPLYPQGGTWLYDRAAWCPGAEVSTKDFELSSWITPGDSLTLDYDLQPGYIWNGQGSWPYYAIESQLVSYSQPNFTLDVAMEEVISPNSNKLYNRFNPMCGKPVVAIKNNGTTPLTSVEIQYGPVGAPKQMYTWHGELAFTDTMHVVLPPIDWSSFTADSINRFEFLVSNPNGHSDQYQQNNKLTTTFSIPPTYDNLLVFYFKTNHLAPYESWQLLDNKDSVIYQNGPLEVNTEYIDTLRMQQGCYRLVVRNEMGEGLQYWANMPPYGNGTAGYARLKDMNEKVVKLFQGDFGNEISQSFTVGMTIDIPDKNPQGYLTIYPNPSRGKFSVSALFPTMVDAQIRIINPLGVLVYQTKLSMVRNAEVHVDLTGYPGGVYLVEVSTVLGRQTRKIVIH